ncbi:MAG: TIGR03773 family transporter-associated surface protein [Rothia sp. (in: high G+C Gram-positive bacteria)]|uniref:TIGR03773 family transporter-associated surface protein n=1 Tax=Rothia sp. (in: high G+C Gram-positive bacteria) TaxID=1885016 RepID=UPI0026E112B2|nr:TIGR03773 family transporter-associated surface protein [Rothia sp. (in: high G+C Gram-positive bacteria)]MDO5750450.1 TIGR03773 family transporter-associated surface protein [Rothia sp. (in: high G+C Gram-positive bacteria)]
MQRSTRSLNALSLSALLTLAPIAALPAQAQESAPAPSASSSAEAKDANGHLIMNGRYIVAGVHTEIVNALWDSQSKSLGLNSVADIDRGSAAFSPASTVFQLPDVESARSKVTKRYDFIAPEGTDIFYIPGTRAEGLLFPGFGAEDIQRGIFKDDALSLELISSTVPEGGRAEIFSETLGEQPRLFSTADSLSPFTMYAGGHYHASWAFTRAGTYELSFRLSAQLLDGTPVSTVQTYTLVVGDVPEGIFEHMEQRAADAQRREQSASPSVSAATSESPSAADTHTTSASPSDSSTSESPSHTQSSTLPGVRAVAAPAEQKGAHSQPAGQNTPVKTDQQKPSVRGANSAQVPAAPRAQAGAHQQAPEKCYPVEVPVEKAQARADALPAQVSVVPVAHRGEAVHEGHFDVGPVFSGSSARTAVKDDRSSPARFVAPESLDFVLGDAAKLALPSGFEDIAPAGTSVHMIGATQQPNVPWLGWNTQDSQLISQASGPITMSLSDFSGPGSMSVFLSGNFGSAGEKVFDSTSRGSFDIPLNTHQHSNWVFTAEGEYTVQLTFTIPLKSGETVSTSGTLHFSVGDTSTAAQQDNTARDSGTPKQSKGSEAQGSESKPGSVDEATGIVTKPDGSRVRIVGKTASGADCSLTNQELTQAQKASAEGKLASTGASIDPLMVLGSLAALIVGAGLLRSLYRSRKES